MRKLSAPALDVRTPAVSSLLLALLVLLVAPSPAVSEVLASGSPPPLKVLATGDSMVYNVAEDLTRRLAPLPQTAVRTDGRSGTGISKPFLLDWPRYAFTQVRREQPDVTVVFSGASDGHPFVSRAGAEVPCCGPAWRAEYARRAGRMMSAYVRGGVGRVYWLLLPQPRRVLTNGRRGVVRQQIYPVVNAAVALAARAFPDSVSLVQLDRVFTPGGRYADVIAYHGRRVQVRHDDGIHLSQGGASIAASIVVARMRGDGLLSSGGTSAAQAGAP